MSRGAAMLLALALAACAPASDHRVRADGHDAFWLWAGVHPRPILSQARKLYILDGEVAGEPGVYRVLRPAVPSVRGPDLWLTVRLDTLRWSPTAMAQLQRRLRLWQAGGGRLVGLQLDFDARTRHLDDYADFLRSVRAALPRPLKLSVTGLLDWSAHGDPDQLRRLASVVDEVAIQTYQDRRTIPGYETYLERLDGFPIPFRIGVVEGGRFTLPSQVARNPNYRGLVVFLVNPPA